MSSFKCDRCGLCCRSLNNSEIYSGFHNGDGICFFLDTVTNLCAIYKGRPTLCNIDASYSLYFSKIMSKESYYLKNKEGCKKIWEMKKKASEKNQKKTL